MLYVLCMSHVVICSKTARSFQLVKSSRHLSWFCCWVYFSMAAFWHISVFCGFFPLPLGLIYYHCCNSWKGHVLVPISWLPREEPLLQSGNAPLLHLGTWRGKSVSMALSCICVVVDSVMLQQGSSSSGCTVKLMFPPAWKKPSKIKPESSVLEWARVKKNYCTVTF